MARLSNSVIQAEPSFKPWGWDLHPLVQRLKGPISSLFNDHSCGLWLSLTKSLWECNTGNPEVKLFCGCFNSWVQAISPFLNGIQPSIFSVDMVGVWIGITQQLLPIEELLWKQNPTLFPADHNSHWSVPLPCFSLKPSGSPRLHFVFVDLGSFSCKPQVRSWGERSDFPFPFLHCVLSLQFLCRFSFSCQIFPSSWGPTSLFLPPSCYLPVS